MQKKKVQILDRKLSKTLLLIYTSLVNSNEHKTPFSFNLYYTFVF
jgi:hypothetical protein